VKFPLDALEILYPPMMDENINGKNMKDRI